MTDPGLATPDGAVAVVPWVLALRPGLLGGLVQVIVALYAALIADTLFAPVVLGIHWDGATTGGALAGVIVGCLSVVAWHVLTDLTPAVGASLAPVPPVGVGVVASGSIVCVVSVAGQRLDTRRSKA